MSPHLRYAQAIHGRVTGRGIGIIDTLHLVEVARAIEALADAPGLSPAERAAVRGWFGQYVEWMTTHEYGIAERDMRNNHASCWVLQVAAFARLAGRDDLVRFCRERFKSVLLPDQMAPDGSFPQETRRTKPYAYSLFNLEALSGIAQLLSSPADDLWAFTLPDGRGMRRGLAFVVPFVRDRKGWPWPKDVMYDSAWPMRQTSLLFGGLALGEPELPRAVVGASRGLRRRGGGPELLHPSAAALGVALRRRALERAPALGVLKPERVEVGPHLVGGKATEGAHRRAGACVVHGRRGIRFLRQDAVLVRQRERVEERPEQRPPIGEVQPHEQPLRERLARVEHRGQDARLRLRLERSGRLRPQVARLDERAERRARELGRRLREEDGGRPQPFFGPEVLPETRRAGFERHRPI